MIDWTSFHFNRSHIDILPYFIRIGQFPWSCCVIFVRWLLMTARWCVQTISSSLYCVGSFLISRMRNWSFSIIFSFDTLRRWTWYKQIIQIRFGGDSLIVMVLHALICEPISWFTYFFLILHETNDNKSTNAQGNDDKFDCRLASHTLCPSLMASFWSVLMVRHRCSEHDTGINLYSVESFLLIGHYQLGSSTYECRPSSAFIYNIFHTHTHTHTSASIFLTNYAGISTNVSRLPNEII